MQKSLVENEFEAVKVLDQIVIASNIDPNADLKALVEECRKTMANQVEAVVVPLAKLYELGLEEGRSEIRQKMDNKIIASIFISCKAISRMQDESPDIEPPFCDLCKTKMDSTEEFKEHLRTKHNIPA